MSDKTATQLYDKLVNNPEMVDGQDISDLRETLKIGLKWVDKYDQRIGKFMMGSTDKNYPEEYLPDDKYQYWEEKFEKPLKYKKTNSLIKKRIDELAENYSKNNESKPKRKEPKPNKFRRELELKAKENESKREQFILEAKIFLKSKLKQGEERSDYITEANWPTVKFYRNPFRSSDIKEKTRQNWLRNAIIGGEFKNLTNE